MENKLRERIGKLLYEKNHPRMFHTFEELKSTYWKAAEGIMQEADKILNIIKEELDGLTVIESLNAFQLECKEWATTNFPDTKHYMPALGVSEEIAELIDNFLVLLGLEVTMGRLHHSHLKSDQDIRKGEKHRENIEDSIGDIVIFLCDYCSRNNFNLGDCVAKTWNNVKKRDWLINNIDGTPHHQGN